jgi:ketosteroid isomerase-like protein
VSTGGSLAYCPAMSRFVLVLLAACAGAAPAVRHFEPADRTAITGVLEAQVVAWNHGDLAAYMAGYARIDDLVFTSGGNVRRGWQTAFDHYKDKYAKDPAAMGNLVFEILTIQPLGADGAVVLGNWILTQSPSDGRGVFSVVLERRPEGWRVVHDHTSLKP